jgi:hypothetical protein
MEIELFVPVMRPDSNHVAFVRDHVDQRVLFKKAAKDGVTLAFCHPGLDRNAATLAWTLEAGYPRLTHCYRAKLKKTTQTTLPNRA